LLSHTSTPETRRPREAQVVALDEEHVALEVVHRHHFVDALDHLLAGLVGGVRLAGED
jgi:hypothetical protein